MAAAVKGENIGHEVACPRCGRAGGLKYTSRRIERGSLWPGKGEIEDRNTPVPECRCAFCRRRFRVLPTEIVPFKSYILAVIETACSAYVAPESQSLKRTVDLMGKGHPDRTTLHGWLGGLGARALGRLDRQRNLPVSALIGESTQRLSSRVSTWWTRRYDIAPAKYRSSRRREQLEACARLFDASRRIFPKQAYPWCAWEKWLQIQFHVPIWSFPSRFRYTAIQQHAPSGPQVMSRACKKNRRSRRKGKRYDTRSPP